MRKSSPPAFSEKDSIGVSHSDLLSIVKNYEGVLLDAYGVFFGGSALGVFPGAAEAMQALVKQGKIVGILSNATQLVEKSQEGYRKRGLQQGIHYHFLLTSGTVTRSLFLSGALPFLAPRHTFYLFGNTPHPLSTHVEIFRDTSYRQVSDPSEADFIYVSIPHIQGLDQEDPALFLDEVKQLLPYRLPLFCSNPDRFAMEGNPPRPLVRAGGIAALYEQLGGFVFYMGKPYERVYEAALQCFLQRGVLAPSQILMIGDSAETDIRGARKMKMGTALITHTGVTAHRAAQSSLPQLLQSFPPEDIPDYLLERLLLPSFR